MRSGGVVSSSTTTNDLVTAEGRIRMHVDTPFDMSFVIQTLLMHRQQPVCAFLGSLKVPFVPTHHHRTIADALQSHPRRVLILACNHPDLDAMFREAYTAAVATSNTSAAASPPPPPPLVNDSPVRQQRSDGEEL